MRRIPRSQGGEGVGVGGGNKAWQYYILLVSHYNLPSDALFWLVGELSRLSYVHSLVYLSTLQLLNSISSPPSLLPSPPPPPGIPNIIVADTRSRGCLKVTGNPSSSVLLCLCCAAVLVCCVNR